MTPEILRKKLLKIKPRLEHEFQVHSLYVFGSCLNKGSSAKDIDLIVNFSKEVSIFDFLRLKAFLEDHLNKNVDLVTPDALEGWMKEVIEKDSVRVA